MLEDEDWSYLEYVDWMNYGAYTALTLLVAAHVTYFIFENFVFEKSLRYATVIFAKLFQNYIFIIRWVLTPYLVVIWASSAVYDKKHDDPSVPKGIIDFTLAIIIIACITFVVRIVLVAFRSLKK